VYGHQFLIARPQFGFLKIGNGNEIIFRCGLFLGTTHQEIDLESNRKSQNVSADFAPPNDLLLFICLSSPFEAKGEGKQVGTAKQADHPT
jgi:hypothetical protein